MKKLAIVLAGIGVTLLFGMELAVADSGAIQTMARITMHLNHFPSDEEKATLQGIVDSDESTEGEADIAMALANMQHKVAEKDAARLTEIVDDDSATAQERELAGILLHINHTPSDADKAKLAALAGE